MKRCLIDIGCIPFDALQEFLNIDKDIILLAETKLKLEELVNRNYPSDRVFLNPCKIVIKNIAYECTDIIDSILSDYKIFQLYDRTENVFSTTSKKIINIASKCESAVCFILSKKIDVVIFNSTPHSCDNWILAKVAEHLGRKVLYFKPTVIPWRYNCLEGLNPNPNKIKINEPVKTDEIKKIDSYIKSKKGSIRTALPDYEKKRLDKNKGKFYSLKNDIINWWRRPDLILNKYVCWRKYNSVSVTPKLDGKYIAFFLHFQPERTTLPEGYLFTQQVLAIKTLRRCTPGNIKIYVKEHPSTFTNICHWLERDSGFYDDIISIPGIELVSMQQDQYDLIDNSICTSSITGTILFESVVRGKPAIAFGLAPSVISILHHKYKSEKLLKTYIKSCVEESLVVNDFDFFELEKSLEYSLNVINVRYKDFQINTNDNHLAAAKGISMILNEKLGFLS